MSAQHIDASQFQTEVLDAQVPVLVDFYADWCGPCKMMAPVLDGLADELAGKAKIIKINVDDNPDLAQQYNVMTIPNLIVFQDGQAADSAIGVQPKPKLMQMLGF